MRFRVRFVEQIVGVFILLALAALAATLVLMGANQRWFAKNFHFKSEFLSGNGLTVGMSVKFRGFEIGKISGIELNERNTVDVDFYVYDTYYDKVRPNSVLELLSNPLGLGGGLVLHPGLDTTSPPPEEGYLIPSFDVPEGRRRLEEGLVKRPISEDFIAGILGQLNPILYDVNQTIRKANDLIATVDAELAGRGSGPVSNLLATVSSELEGTGTGPVSRLLATVSSELEGTGTGPVSRLLGTVSSELDGSGRGPIAATLDEVVKAVDRVNKVVDSINTNIVVATADGVNRVLGQIDGVLKTIDETAVNLATLSSALSDPTGLVPRLMGDQQNDLLGRLNGAIGGVEKVVQQLQSFVAYMNTATPQVSGLIEQTQDVLDQGRDVLTAVRNNPLLRGGVPERVPQATTYGSTRDVEF